MSALRRLVNNYDNWHDHPRRKYPALMEELLELCPPNPRVLRADCFQESQGAPGLYNVCSQMECVEIDPGIIAKARANFPELRITQGDVRALSSAGELFDAICDFSTIDHVEDYRRVLREYHRVLKAGGLILCVVWLHNIANVDVQARVRGIEPVGQFYFSRPLFTQQFMARFDLIDMRLLLTSDLDRRVDLVSFVGRKPCGRELSKN